MQQVRYKKSDFYYELPPELIAQTPITPRDGSRLLVYDRSEDKTEHRVFRDVCDYLKDGDVLVINNTKVLPARMYALTPNGGHIEILLLKRLDKDRWEVLAKPGKKCAVGKSFKINDKLSFTVEGITDSGERIVRFVYDGVFENIIDEVGSMPLPPYIKEKLEDKNRYQT
ncbi:MAG: S-adenosylmethionine:tRNA ribosyltransferase-isomerase, partial [Clostridia bacterium]|nr:S-adenosylmethionine:tRNA ribosyltransferase-isomerase [Clostridia bacterium]